MICFMDMKITFDDEQTGKVKPNQRSEDIGTVTQFIMKISGNRITTQTQANAVMLILTTVCIIGAFMLTVSVVTPPTVEPIYSEYDN